LFLHSAESKTVKRDAGEKISVASMRRVQNKNFTGLESRQAAQNFRPERTHVRDAV
jgi:hypothetical protein